MRQHASGHGKEFVSHCSSAVHGTPLEPSAPRNVLAIVRAMMSWLKVKLPSHYGKQCSGEVAHRHGDAKWAFSSPPQNAASPYPQMDEGTSSVLISELPS